MVGQFVPLNSSLTVWRATAPATTIEGVKKHEVVLGSTGAGSYQYQLPALLNALVGTKFKIILGFKGIPEENLAMERGEIHGRGGTIVSWAITEAALGQGKQDRPSRAGRHAGAPRASRTCRSPPSSSPIPITRRRSS